MNAIELLNQGLQMSRFAFLGLAEDLKDQPLTRAFEGGNHAMWCLGHVLYSEHMLWSVMDGRDNPCLDLKPIFDAGIDPSDDPSIYPSYEKLLTDFQSARDQTLTRLNQFTDADLDTPSSNVPEGLDAFFGTWGMALNAMLIHAFHHRGQLADIRRSLQRDVIIA